MNNPTRKWLIQSRYWGAIKDRQISHLLFDGGKASVPDDMCSTLANVMCNAIAKGHALFTIEQKSPVFKLFMDLDLRCNEELREAQVESVVNFIKDRANAFYLGESALIVCRRPVAQCKDGPYSLKSGIHLI